MVDVKSEIDDKGIKQEVAQSVNPKDNLKEALDLSNDKEESFRYKACLAFLWRLQDLFVLSEEFNWIYVSAVELEKEFISLKNDLDKARKDLRPHEEYLESLRGFMGVK